MKQALELGKDLECDISVELAKKYVLPSLILCPWLELPEFLNFEKQNKKRHLQQFSLVAFLSWLGPPHVYLIK